MTQSLSKILLYALIAVVVISVVGGILWSSM